MHVKVSFKAENTHEWDNPAQGFSYSWNGEVKDPSEFLTNLRDFIDGEVNGSKVDGWLKDFLVSLDADDVDVAATMEAAEVG